VTEGLPVELLALEQALEQALGLGLLEPQVAVA